MRVIYIYWGTGPSWKILPGAEKNAGSLNYIVDLCSWDIVR